MFTVTKFLFMKRLFSFVVLGLLLSIAIKTWEYEKDGLKLDKIEAIDKSNNKVLFEMKGSDFERIYKEPIAPNPFFQWDKLDGYYMSIQVQVPISETVPETIINRLYFTDTINNESVSFEGGELKPRTDEKPLIINPPVKGNNLCFMMQSSSKYHFHILMFVDGGIYSGERFAFDEMTFASNWFDYDTIDNAVCSGDLHLNESYFNYGDTLYAVAKGEIVEKVDGRPDRHGNLLDTPLNTIDEFYGNYLVLKIAENQYEFYCHVIPGSFMVDKIGNVFTGSSVAVEVQNAMMEQFSIVNIDF